MITNNPIKKPFSFGRLLLNCINNYLWRVLTSIN